MACPTLQPLQPLLHRSPSPHSLGFDAHKKDEINFRYIGVTERDFEWLTEQLVQVANACCEGRLVSVLEGGYRIQGAKVSAFARSVAAHVRALSDPHRARWDPAAAEWERQHEKALRAELAAKRAAAAARAAEPEGAAAETAAPPEGAEGAVAPPEGAAAAAPDSAENGRKRRRRAEGVDYVALNKLLEQESAANGTVTPAQD